VKECKMIELRNVGLFSHTGAGKTSLAEAMLYLSGAIKRLGRIEEGNTASDYDPEEVRRGISINASVIPLEWQDHKINLLDTPGYDEFVGEVKGAIRVSDSAIIVVGSVTGVEVGTERVWRFADEEGLPKAIFVSRMDRENADFQKVLGQLRETFGKGVVAAALPIGAQETFRGVVDLVSQKAFVGEKAEEADLPSELTDDVATHREALVEAAAESNDDLTMKYLEGEPLSDDDIRRGLKEGVAAGRVIPVFCGSSISLSGIRVLMDAIIHYLPSPLARTVKAMNPVTGEEEQLDAPDSGPLAALILKTFADPFVGTLSYFRVYSGMMESDSRVFNPRSGEEERLGQLYMLRGKEQIPVSSVKSGDIGGVAKLQSTETGDTLCDRDHPLQLPSIEYPKPVFDAAVRPKTKVDLDKMSNALARLIAEDPTLNLRRDSETSEVILSGMGESHIDVAIRKLREKFKVDVVLEIPKVPYRETIRKTSSAEGRHKKQTGGRGQFGHVVIRFEPLPRGEGFIFEDEVFGGAVPRNYIPAVEKGLREAIKQGILAGYPAVDIRAVLYDGSYHTVDSSEIAFKIAATLSYKKAMLEGNPVLLEPIMDMVITVPEQFLGDILGDLNTRRARVMGMDQQDGKSIVTAQSPLAEIQRYATDLRSMTQGQGYFNMEFSHYEEVPTHAAQSVIEAAKAAKEK